MDINDVNFIEMFNSKNTQVGLIGYGFVGKAVENFFGRKFVVNVCDLKFKKEEPEFYQEKSRKSSLKDVVKNSDVIFIAVPTPMKNDGSCYTGFVENVLKDIRKVCEGVRALDSFICVIKSTVYPGFTEDMRNLLFPLRIVFCPEFLTEKNSLNDFLNNHRVILGGDESDARVVSKYFEFIYPEKVEKNVVLLLRCDSTVAEMVKLYTNGILMTKVLFSNEIYKMCEKLGITYEEVRSLACLDKRIGNSHTKVPGHDGDLGASGSCFPKDINNLRAFSKLLGVNEKLFTAVIERNNELRDNRDWELLYNRAVINE